MPVTFGKASVTARSRDALVGVGNTDGGDVRVGRMLEQAGTGDQREIQRQALPGDLAQAGNLQIDIAAEHIDPDGVADMDAPAAGEGGIERHERRAVILGPPPVACDDVVAGGRIGGVGQSPIAAQRPGSVRRGLDLVGRNAIHRDDAGSEAGNLLHVLDARLGVDQRLEARQLGVLDVDEEEAGSFGRKLVQDLPLDVALDQRNRCQGGEAEANRDQHQRGGGPWAVQAGEAKANGGAANAAGCTGGQHDQRAAEAEQQQRAQSSSTEPQREGAIRRGANGQPDEGQHGHDGGHDDRGGGQYALGQKRVAEQCRSWNASGTAQWPERKGDGGQQAVGSGESQRSWIEPEDGGNRQHVLEPACQGERRDGAEEDADANACQGKRHDLGQTDREYQARGAAEAAQRGDGACACVEPRSYSVGNADAAYQKRSEADKGHEQTGLVDETDDTGRGITRIADAPALIREGRFQRGLDIG